MINYKILSHCASYEHYPRVHLYVIIVFLLNNVHIHRRISLKIFLIIIITYALTRKFLIRKENI